MQKRVLVTGGTGFIGSALIQVLADRGYKIKAATRQPVLAVENERVSNITVGSIDDSTHWADALKDIDVVVHLAARVHVMEDKAVNPLDAYRKVNSKGTRHLAQSAAHAGVRRFVFLSTVKVNGEERPCAYKEENAPAPADAYGASKEEAEQALRSVAAGTGMECVILRPPLVYGPGVKANFRSLLGVVERNIPLPLAGVRNQRSLIYLGNLVDSIIECMTHPAAANQTYLVSDGRDLSTPELIRAIAASLKTRCMLFPFPVSFLKIAGKLTGKVRIVKRLLGSLSVDISKIKRELAWQPPYSVESGLRHTAKWYKER